MRLQHILLPVDFSEGSVVAARQAGILARHLHAEVTVLHVREEPVLHSVTATLGSTGAELDRAATAQEQLSGFGDSELAGVEVTRVLCSGDPARIIVECAHQRDADLILMSTRGAGSFRRFLLGSVTAKVLHDADCPVWTSAHLPSFATAGSGEIHRVLCGVNLEPGSRKVVGWAMEIARAFGASLTVAHAITAMPPELPERYASSWHEGARWGADEKLRALLRESAIHAEVLIVDGDPARALSAAARETDFGLLVIGRSFEPDAHGRLGGKAYGIISQSSCPVVSI